MNERENKKTYIQSLINEVNTRLQPFAKASFTTVEKNNGVMLDALRFEVPAEISISPIIYLDGFYGMTFEEAASDIVDIYNARCNPGFDLSAIARNMRDQDWILAHVQPRLTSHPAEGLISIPFLDLFITFAIEISTNSWIQLYENNCDIDRLDLLDHAKKNFPIQITSLYDRMWELMPGFNLGDPNDLLPVYVLSNADGFCGAPAILDKDNLKQFAEKLDDSLYILPSSIHECLAIPASFGDPEDLRSMVQAINASDVIRDDEFLSNSIYIFVKDRCHLSFI